MIKADFPDFARVSGGQSRMDPDRTATWKQGLTMAHEIAKLLLEKAGTFIERTEAIKAASQMGMPLHEIQEYLDWLDAIRPLRADNPDEVNPSGEGPP